MFISNIIDELSITHSGCYPTRLIKFTVPCCIFLDFINWLSVFSGAPGKACWGNTYKCEVCPKQFNHKTDPRRHMCLHIGEKPFSCNVCGKGFIREDRMVKHADTPKKKAAHVVGGIMWHQASVTDTVFWPLQSIVCSKRAGTHTLINISAKPTPIQRYQWSLYSYHINYIVRNWMGRCAARCVQTDTLWLIYGWCVLRYYV